MSRLWGESLCLLLGIYLVEQPVLLGLCGSSNLPQRITSLKAASGQALPETWGLERALRIQGLSCEQSENGKPR